MARAEGPAAQIAADASELGRALDAGQPARLPAARALSGMCVAAAGQIPQSGRGWRDPSPAIPFLKGGGHFPSGHAKSKIHSLANLAAARATCRLAAAARRSQARRGSQPTQDAGLHPRPRLCPAHGRLAARVRGRRAVVEDVGVRHPDGGQAAADDARPRPPEHAAPAAVGARRARRCLAPRARSARPSAATS